MRSTRSAALLLLGLSVPGAARAQSLSTDLRMTIPPESPWSATIPSPADQAIAWSVYNLRLIGLLPSGELWAIPMINGGIQTDAPVRLASQPLPQGFTPAFMEVLPERLVLAGTRNGAPLLVSAKVDAAMALAEWQPLPPFPNEASQTIEALTSSDDSLLVLVTETGDTGTFRTGWSGTLLGSAEKVEWLPLPLLKTPREGAAFLLLGSRVVHAGGINPTSRRPVGQIDIARLQGSAATPWQLAFPALPGRVGAVVGTTTPNAMMVAAAEPVRDDTTTSASIFLSGELGQGQLSPWAEQMLSQPAEPTSAIVWDSASRNVVLLTQREGKLIATAHTLPDFLSSKRPTAEEIERAGLRKRAAQPERIGLDDAILRGKANRGWTIAVVGSGEEGEDLAIRTAMNQNAWRYMTMGIQVTYLAGADGQPVLQRYGVNRTPAYLLLDGEGAMVRSHTGGVITPAEVFSLTEPSRQARDTTTPGATP